MSAALPTAAIAHEVTVIDCGRSYRCANPTAAVNRQAEAVRFAPLVVRVFVTEVKPSQCLAKLRGRISVLQYSTHVSQCVGDADAAQPRAVECGDGGRAALGLHAVDKHCAASPAQLLDCVDGIEQHEVSLLPEVSRMVPQRSRCPCREHCLPLPAQFCGKVMLECGHG